MLNKNIQRKVEALEKGEVIVSRESGNSLKPIVSSREPVILTPVKDFTKEIKLGDICFVKVHGTYITHMVYGINPDKGILVGNIRKHMNGWTKQIYGLAHLIPKEYQTSKEKTEKYRKIIEEKWENR